MVARAFLSSSLLLWSMSSISRTFCRGVRESWNQARNSQSPQRREGRAGLQSLGHSRPFLSAHISYSTLIPLLCCFSYLGDLSKDDPSVLSALSQGLHVSQELFSLLDFLHHWTGRRGISVPGCGAFGLLAGVAGTGVASQGEGTVLWLVFLTSGPSGVTPSPSSGPLHTFPPSITGPRVAYVLQTCPAPALGSPVAQEGVFFFVPVCPSLWQRCFGACASPSPDLL